MMASGLCKSYCSRATRARQCARVDCMGCAGCNVSTTAMAAAIARLGALHNMSCDSEGGFRIPESTAWPAPYHLLDEPLARFVQSLVGASPLLDVGAGSGQYGAFYEARRRAGDAAVPEWSGVDGAQNIEAFTRRRGPPGARVRHANLCDAALRLPPSAWVMSLEVGEHLPAPCVQTYARQLARTARAGLVLSWAHEGQGGKCHVSTRSGAWVEATFGALGWHVDRGATEQCRGAARLSWLRQNTFVFRPARGSGQAWRGVK